MTKRRLKLIAQGGPVFAQARDLRGRAVVQWRLKRAAPFYPPRDTAWSRFGTMPARTAAAHVRALNREDPDFEYRIKPKPNPKCKSWPRCACILQGRESDCQPKNP